MRKLILVTALLTSSATASAWQCGIAPIPPIGCTRDNAVCICDEYGNCRWIFVGCGRY